MTVVSTVCLSEQRVSSKKTANLKLLEIDTCKEKRPVTTNNNCWTIHLRKNGRKTKWLPTNNRQTNLNLRFQKGACLDICCLASGVLGSALCVLSRKEKFSFCGKCPLFFPEGKKVSFQRTKPPENPVFGLAQWMDCWVPTCLICLGDIYNEENTASTLPDRWILIHHAWHRSMTCSCLKKSCLFDSIEFTVVGLLP